MVIPLPKLQIIHFPIPVHQGIVISNTVQSSFNLDELKTIVGNTEFDVGFELIDNTIAIKLLGEYETDTLWLVRWNKYDQNIYAVVFGSEI